ncbi:MAG: site-specific DNA-methyltransferase [Thermomicrobiales bacterium]
MAVVKKGAAVRVGSIRHRESRVNIPTEELRDFVTEERAPATMRYPRDPSLDPQLVWKGKDEQDRADLALPVVPIYIQEKIHPQALIDDLPRASKAAGDQLDLFADFNGLDGEFDRKVEFYKHDQHWTNRMILGDSLLVMTSLAEKEGLKGKVQTIYLDPPYGIKFGSNWQGSTRKRDVKDGSAEDATRQPEQVKAFRDTWRLGVHSYLAYLRDRLVAARELLTETGRVFVQIGDEDVHLVRNLLDEVFGSENFVAQVYFVTTTGRQEATLDRLGNYLLWYASNREEVKFRQVYQDRAAIESDRPSLGDLQSQGVRSTGSYPVAFENKTYQPLSGNHWKVTEAGMSKLIAANRVQATISVLRFRRYSADFPAVPLADVWTDTSGGAGLDKVYVVQTGTKVIERCILMATDPRDLVLDPTCGSGTTAYVAEQWGRRWITVDTSRVALALARTRLMAGRYPYYLLTDSPEEIKKEGELTGKLPPAYTTEGDVRKGFVCRRVPHVTLKSIANNPDIREGMTRAEIDAAIARHAETETLYDQPYEDKGRVRASGPFTVESLSPHRVLATATEDEGQGGGAGQKEAMRGQDFATMILDNLRKAGVQNTRRAERLVFDRLEPFAGRWINATGEFTEADGAVRRVAVTIGPEHGTVGPGQVKERRRRRCWGWATTCCSSAVSRSTRTSRRRPSATAA